MSLNPVRPEDIVPDGVDHIIIDGKMVRKGTVGAFLANANIYEDENVSAQQKQNAFATMKELAPAIITIGLHKHVLFRNPEIEQVLIEAAQK